MLDQLSRDSFVIVDMTFNGPVSFSLQILKDNLFDNALFSDRTSPL